jgi:hypothetical protein
MKGRLDRATFRLSQNPHQNPPQNKERTSILHTMKKGRDCLVSSLELRSCGIFTLFISTGAFYHL